ncbi:GDP-mannose 4,6-dehydratase [Candidatus Woesearchaeota archaeon]|nr:GDP-mannose 4,6-dehydratase [Candidatus Woesearchaeota archaeon]
MPTAFITGITGQDGSWLADFLLSKGYKVYGMYVSSTRFDDVHPARYFENITHLNGRQNFHLLPGNLLDMRSIELALQEAQPDEIYNLAAQSQVHKSTKEPELTFNVNSYGVDRLLRMAKKVVPGARIYQASTSEMFGNAPAPQDENTPFVPVSPYGEAKLDAHEHITRHRHEGNFSVGGILFNHESERRGRAFVTRKITHGLAGIKLGHDKELRLGNLDAKRDWGYAPDYVRAMWLMLQQKEPNDYVISTGETHTVREFVEAAAHALDMTIEWSGAGVDEKGIWNGKEIIVVDKQFYRPNEIHTLSGNSAKAQRELKWKPEVTFQQLVKRMAQHDLTMRQTNG